MNPVDRLRKKIRRQLCECQELHSAVKAMYLTKKKEIEERKPLMAGQEPVEHFTKESCIANRGKFSEATMLVDHFISVSEEIDADLVRHNYDLLLRMIVREIIADYAGSKILLHRCSEDNTCQLFPFSKKVIEKNRAMGISDHCVFTQPWNPSRFFASLNDVQKNGFKRSKYEKCRANYYPELDLLEVTQGYHHASVAELKKIGVIEDCRVTPLTPYFEIVTTDGGYWYAIEDGMKKEYPVDDYRFALLFHFLVQRHRFEQTAKKENPS